MELSRMISKAPLGDVVIGAHGGFLTWIFDLIQQLAPSLRRVIKIDPAEKLELWREPRPILLTTYPSDDILDAIERGDLNVLFVSEDALDVSLFLHRTFDFPVLDAMRLQTASAVANLTIGRSDRVRYLDRASLRNVGQVVSCLATALYGHPVDQESRTRFEEKAFSGLDTDSQVEDALARHLNHYAPPIRSQSLPGEHYDPLLFVAADVLDPLMAMAKGHTIRPVVWPTQVFKFGDRPEAPPPRTANISGPSRNLFYGPYFHLPPARYRVEAIIEFSDEIQDIPFVLEVAGQRELARARIAYRKAGNYRGYFYFDHHDAQSTVEIRLRNEQGVQRGKLSLVEMALFVEQPATT